MSANREKSAQEAERKGRVTKSRRSVVATAEQQSSLVSTKSTSKQKVGPNASVMIAGSKMTMAPTEESNHSDPPTIDEPSKSFRRFLESSSGIKDAIIRSMVSLYEEEHKPDDPICYITRLLGHGIPVDDKIAKYQAYLEKLRAQYLIAKDENAELTAMHLAKQAEHRRIAVLQEKCARQKQRQERDKHHHQIRALRQSRKEARALALTQETTH